MKAILKFNRNHCRTRCGYLWLVVVLSLVRFLAPAATLADFGYQHMAVDGQIASGNRPLLLICVNFAGQSPLPQPLSYYSNLVFSASQNPGFNGYFQAVSDGAFSFTPAGAILVTLPAAGVFTNVYAQHPAPPNPFATADGVYASNIIHAAMSSFDFANYDANQDGHVTQAELAIVIIVSDSGWTLGGCRSVPSVPSAGIIWGGGLVSLLGYPAPFIIMAEETEETLGTPDIYGPDCLSCALTPQSCFFSGDLYYLDPWNRMELGWCQPRIFSLTAGGITPLSAAQAGDPTAPIILYDSSKGTNEFFLLEYRTHLNSVFGPGYDHDVALGQSDGLVVWHIQQDTNHNLVHVTSPISTNLTPSIWAEGSPNLIPGCPSTLWGSNAKTPVLKWMDGTQTATTLHVKPFNPGDNTITVQWLSAEDTWVDFNYSGSPQTGTFSNPYNSMNAGINAVSYGGTLHLKTGRSPETPFITKPMKIVGYNGPASVGN